MAFEWFDDHGQNTIKTPEQKAQEEAELAAFRIAKETSEQNRRAALSPDERKKEDDAKKVNLIEDYYKKDLINLYTLADDALNKSEGLLKTYTSYNDLRQTQFGEELKKFLKKINQKSSIMGKSFSCDLYIDSTFSNNILPDFGINGLSINCRGSSQILNLYNYLIKITSKYLQAFSVSQREEFKKEFRKELSRNLVLICSGIYHQEDVKKMIRNSIEDPEIIGNPYSQNHKDDLLKIYKELDTLFSSDSLTKGTLLNKEGKKTEFKKKLIDFLRDITLNKCNRAITAIFVNNDNPYFTGIFCSSKNKIQELYNYLNEFEYKNDGDISNKETQKQDLKKKLSKSLIDISFRNKIIQQSIKETPPDTPQYIPQDTPQDTPQYIPHPIEDQATSATPDTQPPINDKKKYMSYENYLEGNASDRPAKFEQLSPIYKIYVTYEENKNIMITPDTIYNQLTINVNEQIIERYEQIDGTKFFKSRGSKSYTKPVEEYDELDRLIKKIYIDEDPEYTKYTDYLRKKIETDVAIEETRERVNREIALLQPKLDSYKNYISKLDNLLSENKEYFRNPNNTPQLGGNTKITKSIKKDILGKSRCIYKKSGDRKQYIKHKGALITISDYKRLMAAKNTK